MRRQREKEINPIEVKLNIRTGRMEKQCWRCHRAIVITGNRPKIVKCRRCDSLNQLRKSNKYVMCRKCGLGVGSPHRVRVCPKCGHGKFKALSSEQFWQAASRVWRAAEGITRVRDLSQHNVDHFSTNEKVLRRRRRTKKRPVGWRPGGAAGSSVRVIGRRRSGGTRA